MGNLGSTPEQKVISFGQNSAPYKLYAALRWITLRKIPSQTSLFEISADVIFSLIIIAVAYLYGNWVYSSIRLILQIGFDSALNSFSAFSFVYCHLVALMIGLFIGPAIIACNWQEIKQSKLNSVIKFSDRS